MGHLRTPVSMSSTMRPMVWMSWPARSSMSQSSPSPVRIRSWGQSRPHAHAARDDPPLVGTRWAQVREQRCANGERARTVTGARHARMETTSQD